MSHTHPYCKVVCRTGILIIMFGFLFLSFPHIFCLLQLFGVYKIFLMSANVLCPKKNGKHFVSGKRVYKPSFVKKKQNLRVVSERREQAALVLKINTPKCIYIELTNLRESVFVEFCAWNILNEVIFAKIQFI